MTDKELLELAAKAVGIPFNWVKDWAGNEGVGFDGDGRALTLWNPLADDGDALRLAVKLGIDVLIILNGSTTTFADSMKNEPRFQEKHDQDPLAATRRAIVRAAAEIGKGIK